jgi:ABC-type transporter Mla subunit MlaD
MAVKTNYFRLGLFVLVALAILFALLFILGGRSLFEPKVIVETYFDESVSGLKVGSPVEFRGVPLGQVTEITISARVYQQHVALDDRGAYIVVRAQLQGPAAEEAVAALSDYIKRGLRFPVKNLQKASAQLDRLLGNPALETAPKDISVMTGRLKRIAESGELEDFARNLNQTLARAEAILSNNQYDIRAAIEDLRVTADNLRTLTEKRLRQQGTGLSPGRCALLD